MTITREDLNPATVQLTVTCAPEEVSQGFEKAYKNLAKQVRLPGFRPGHVPKAMIEGHIDQNSLYEEAADQIVRSLFKKAVEDQKLELDQSLRPSVELKLINKEEGTCEFIAKVPLPPVVELGDYKGLVIETPSTEVTDAEVEHQLQELRQRKGTKEAITDRGVQEGDVAVVNIKPDGFEGDGRNFMLIAGQTFAQLDQAMANMQVEEMKHIELTFPANFQEADWAGKAMPSQVRINSLSTISLPELDDEFAQSLKTENVDELKVRLKGSIEVAKQNMVREMEHEQLMERLRERSTVHVSDNMWEPIVAQRLQDMAKEQQEKGKNLTEYAEENGLTPETLTESLKEQAKLHVQRAIMIREIFTKEKMQITNVELNEELHLMASEYGMPAGQMLELLKANEALDELHFRSLSRKVTNFLAEHAERKEVAVA